MNLLDRASKYLDGINILSEWLPNGICVAPEDAQKRADICLGCEHNKEGNHLVFAAAMHVKRQKEFKSRLDLKVKGEKDLHTCDACLCACSLKIWLPMQDLLMGDGKERLKEYPAWCWMRKENNL